MYFFVGTWVRISLPKSSSLKYFWGHKPLKEPMDLLLVDWEAHNLQFKTWPKVRCGLLSHCWEPPTSRFPWAELASSERQAPPRLTAPLVYS